MNLLYYSDLNIGKLQKSFDKVEGFLKKGDFKSADVKKMVNTSFYRAKLDRTNRLLFKFAKHQGETYLLFLEVIHQHDYDKSRFLGGAEIKEQNFKAVSQPEKIPEEDQQALVYVNPEQKSFYLLDKVISLDKEQQQIYGLPAPLIIIGSAGSGKTALTLEKMKHFRGKVAYLSRSPYLVENAQKIYYANNYDNPKQEIDFLSFSDYLESIQRPEGRDMAFRDFDYWFSRYRQAAKLKDSYKLFEEFKGVLTGSVTDKPYLSRSEYLNLGVKQSIYLEREREKVYDVFEKYLAFLEEGQFYDSNIVAYRYLEKVEPQYDFLVVDEVQDLTNVQLMLILKSLNKASNFLLSGDSNQIVHPNFFSWSKLKSMFYQQDLQGSLIRILKTNYRNSKEITELSNTLLKIKNARFGSIDKESTYLIDTVSESEGEINFYEDKPQIKKDLNQRTQNSTKFAVLVMNREDKAKVRKDFDTPLVFSIQEAKGLEYENIILYNFMSENEDAFRNITDGVSDADLSDEAFTYSRAKNKENKELEAYKFYINSLYVAFTRAVKNIYIIEARKKQRILELLNIRKIQQAVKVEEQESDDQDWLDEAERLEQQGKFEQAQEIRDRLKGVKHFRPEELEEIKKRALDSQLKDNQARKQLLEYLEGHYDANLLDELANLNYAPAVAYRRKVRKDLKDYETYCKNNKTKDIKKIIHEYGVDIKTPKEGNTGLMLAILHHSKPIMDFFLERKASIQLQNEAGFVPIQLVLRSYELETFAWKNLGQYYSKLKMPFIRCASTERVIKISEKSMEYFLLHYLLAVRDLLISPNDPPEMQGLTMNEFVEFIEEMPEQILPDYRRKRQYINSILAKNEINRDDRYNKKLFIRVSRGCYNLNPDLEMRYRG